MLKSISKPGIYVRPSDKGFKYDVLYSAKKLEELFEEDLVKYTNLLNMICLYCYIFNFQLDCEYLEELRIITTGHDLWFDYLEDSNSLRVLLYLLSSEDLVFEDIHVDMLDDVFSAILKWVDTP